MTQEKLFMVLLGGRPPGRHIEQHDIFMGIASSIQDCVPSIKKYWPEAGTSLHADAWREVNCVDGFTVRVADKEDQLAVQPGLNELFFINLGGYKENEFNEFHYSMLVVAESIAAATLHARQTIFYRHHSIAPSGTNRKAVAHVDDKLGIDVDDIHAVKDMLTARDKKRYSILLTPNSSCSPDTLHLGFFRLKDLAGNSTAES
jgi:hypothetical protein